MAIAVAGALVGADADDSDGDMDSPDISGAGDDADTSTPLGDAQPFEYSDDMPDGDVEDPAASTNNPRYAAKAAIRRAEPSTWQVQLVGCREQGCSAQRSPRPAFAIPRESP